jgi:hypothetical protein
MKACGIEPITYENLIVLLPWLKPCAILYCDGAVSPLIISEQMPYQARPEPAPHRPHLSNLIHCTTRRYQPRDHVRAYLPKPEHQLANSFAFQIIILAMAGHS